MGGRKRGKSGGMEWVDEEKGGEGWRWMGDEEGCGEEVARKEG